MISESAELASCSKLLFGWLICVGLRFPSCGMLLGGR